jgi:glycosyltransferase XagB
MYRGDMYLFLLAIYAAVQVTYFAALAVNGYFYTRRTDWIAPSDVARPDLKLPPILLLYPVLREAEETMRTTMLSIRAAILAYAPGHVHVVSIPNADDSDTIASLERLCREFEFLEILRVPVTSDESWSDVWTAWDENPKVYWWHTGKRRQERNLPPKKTRQLTYALYCYAAHLRGGRWMLSYLDADSAVPVDYFKIAAAGGARFDVIQLTNVAGNLLDTWASSFHSMDHMAWDGGLYPHMTARGRHPYYVLGKGLFYRIHDLITVGGFNPWLTIEDPEIGMKLWVNGKTLGVSDIPLVEEVPRTFRGGITQRKRWVAGFFQSLHSPLKHMGMTLSQRFRARLNLVPLMSLAVNVIGLPMAVWAVLLALSGTNPFDLPLLALSVLNILGALAIIARIYYAAWTRTRMVFSSYWSRLAFVTRVNPIFLLLYWVLWLVPIGIGIKMFLFDGGLVWQRTEKVDANHDLVRTAGILTGSDIEMLAPRMSSHTDATAPERPASRAFPSPAVAVE